MCTSAHIRYGEETEKHEDFLWMPAFGSHAILTEAELSKSLRVGSWPRLHHDFSDHLRLHNKALFQKTNNPPPQNKTIFYGLNVST